MRTHLLAALTGLLVVALVVPAAAEHGGPHPTFRLEPTYFHCEGDVKLQNVAVVQGQIPSWDATPPPGSVQEGHGCGFYDPLLTNTGAPGNMDGIWEGTFTGNLRNLTVELHRLLPAAGVTFPNRFNITVDVDGASRLANDNVVMTPEVSSTGASQKLLFTLEGLGYASEDGDGEIERTIRLQVRSFNETQSLWVFDTTEVPAGITFNPEAPSGTIVLAS
jgi:hypothetical protein